MSSPWSFITKRFADTSEPKIAAPAPVAATARSEPVEPRRPAHILDGIGQRDELLRVRMSEMAERLEDLKTLGEDFSQMLGPMESISSELPVAKGRVTELEVLLGQEVEQNQVLRREVDGLSSRISTLSSDLSGSHGRAGRLEAALRERESAVEELRLSLRERSLLNEELERRLQLEAEQGQAAVFEVKSLRAEMQIADQGLLDAERRLADLAERRSVAESEAQRFQTLAEDLNGRLVSAGSRMDELDSALEESLAALAGLEIQLASEQAAHQRAQAQYDAELATLRTQQSNLTMKADSLAARHQATEQILHQVRSQLRDKEDALRMSERSAKEAAAERGSLERRFEAAREEVARRDALSAEGQRQAAELEDRNEMLTKALAAREASLESANARTQHLSERVDALTLRYEKERQSLETANRRLLEELQNERAERTLAQGALDIARESRLSLQRQNETLKRAARGRQLGEVPMPAEPSVPDAPSNVAIFPAGDRKGDDAR